MSQKILVPTNFRVESLNMVREIAENNHELKADIILACGAHPPDSITELLFFSKKKLKSSLMNEDFIKACRFIENRYQSKINSISIELVVFNTNSFIKNFLSAHEINTIYLPSSEKLTPLNKGCFDLCPILKKNHGGDIKYLHWSASNEKSISQNPISDLFFRNFSTSSISES